MLASSSLIVVILRLLIILMLLVLVLLLVIQLSPSLAFSILRSMGCARAINRRPLSESVLAVALAGDGARSKGTLFAHIFHKEVRFSRVLKNARLVGRQLALRSFGF